MQQKSTLSYRYVHIILLWMMGLLFGMYLSFGYKDILFEYFVADMLSKPSLIGLLVSTVLPLVFVLIAVRFYLYSFLYLLIFVKAFLYGFSLIAYCIAFGGGFVFLSGVLLFSQSCGCILFLFLSFLLIQRISASTKQLSCFFIPANLFLVVLDYFIISSVYTK